MHWKKTAEGYALGLHRLLKGRRWTLVRADGQRFELGRRASFDTAEKYL